MYVYAHAYECDHELLGHKAYKQQYSNHEHSSTQILFFKCHFLLKWPQHLREMLISGLELGKYKLSPAYADVLELNICQQREEGSACSA